MSKLTSGYTTMTTTRSSHAFYFRLSAQQHLRQNRFSPDCPGQTIADEWPKYLLGAWLVIVTLFAPMSAIAEGLQQPLNLNQEPIQPLSAPTGLDPRKIALGEKLFNEPRLGRDNDMACSTCHQLNDNGANHLTYNLGRDGIKLDTNTLTVFNSSLNHYLFWDGRARNLEEQVDFVVHSPKEFATSWPVIINKLKQDESYKQRFNTLYADGITADNIRNAIAIFERSLITVNSRFDQFLLGNNDAISAKEKSGYQLFKAYGCIACHQGQNVGGNLFMKFGIFYDHFSGRSDLNPADLGRFNVTGKPSDRHVFRVPSLRLVALTAPYFHDGSVGTLEAAIRVMAEYQLGRVIPEQDITRIAAFLKSLVGEYQGRTLGKPSSEQSITGDAP